MRAIEEARDDDPTSMVSPADLEPIHQVLDDIAGLVGAPALVEDRDHVLIAYSRHHEPGDRVRAATILDRQASPAVAAWLRELGISRATRPVRVPANPALGMRPRVCLPLRDGDRLLGYLWFIDEDMDMSDFDLGQAAEAAGVIVTILNGSQSWAERARPGLVASLLSGVLVDDPETRRLMDIRLAVAGHLRVLAVRHRAARPPASSTTLTQALSALVSGLPPGAAIGAVLDDIGALVVVEPPGSSVCVDLSRAVAGQDGLVVIGLSDPVREVRGLPAAWACAQDACHCLLLWPDLGTVLDWPTAGLYRLVPSLAQQDNPTALLVDKVRQIAAHPELGHLVGTAETYLDLAAHAQEAAGALVLHRTTLYQRLHRFTEVSGLDLRQGDQRTLAHLVLKAARFRTLSP